MPDDHLGWQTIRRIHSNLKIDEEWTDWHDDGFTWWAHRLAQRFRFTGPLDVQGIDTWWVSFETDSLDGFQQGPDSAENYANAWNQETGSFTCAPDRGRLYMRCRTYVLRETLPHRAWQLGERAMLANIFASRLALSVDAGQLDLGTSTPIPMYSSHPRNGVRTAADDMLNVIDAVYRTHERDASEIHAVLGKAKTILAMSGFVGSTEGVSFLAMQRPDTVRGGAVGILIDTAAKDDVLGSGLRVRTVLPKVANGDEDAQTAALALNDAAWVTNEPLSGTGPWAAGPEGSLVHTSFYPSASLHDQVLIGAVMDEVAHANWGSAQLAASR